MIDLIAQTLPVNPDAGFELTAGGWFVMILCVGGVTGLLAWCISRVLRESPDKIHSPVDIEPPDERAEREGKA